MHVGVFVLLGFVESGVWGFAFVSEGEESVELGLKRRGAGSGRDGEGGEELLNAVVTGGVHEIWIARWEWRGGSWNKPL